MPRFLFLLSPRAGEDESAAALGARTVRFMEWVARGTRSGVIRGGARLASHAAIVTRAAGVTTASETSASPDRIAGYFVIEAESLVSAIAVAGGCPGADPGVIRVLEVDCDASIREEDPPGTPRR
jgi:hypothetical protein